MYPAGDAIGHADVSVRPDFNGAAVARRPSAALPSRSIPHSRSWPDGSRCCPGRPPTRNGWRPSSTPPRSTRSPSTAPHRSTRHGPCSALSCVPPVQSRCMADATFAVAEEPPWSPWRALALIGCAEAHLLLGNNDRRVHCSSKPEPWRQHWAMSAAVMVSRSELARVGDG